jgi:dynein heavy chain
VLERCYCPHIIERDDYRLSASGLYFAPPPGPRSAYIEYIDTLPIIPLPEAFGLHENADIAKDQNDTEAMFAALLSMGGGSGGGKGGGSSAEERVAAIVRECLARLPPNYDIETVQRKYPVLYEESMNTVLAQEMSRFNKLLSVIRDSLKNINLAVQGLLVMSTELEGAFRNISLNAIPDLWKKASYPSLKPLGSYLEDLYRRLKMLQDWYEHGVPPIFWLSGFFFVQSFLTAGLQNYARKNKIPIDMVGYDYSMLDVDVGLYTKPPADGVYIYGAYLDGCGWDNKKKQLCESEPKVLFVNAPCMWLVPKPQDEMASYPHYRCPLYRTPERKGVLATTGHSTNFVMFVNMPLDPAYTGGMPDTGPQAAAQHWRMRGVAMLSQLND